MAKETIIVFVYDMEYCKAEEDDPAKAVLYFHPSWVSEQQKANLCGQIVGATHFLSVTFSPPRFISLQSGRFHLTIEDRYLIVVGTDRNVDDWILERRSNIIMSLLKFFHGDLQSVAEQTQNYNNLCEKLYSMFETYLKILYFNANTFSNTPLLNLPKSASSVFLEAIQILQYCQEMETVLGGTLLYHNKVLATQLDAELTKMLVMTDPYRIKSSAEIVHTDYNLPLGVQLMYVYIPYRKHISLSKDCSRLQSLTDPISWAPPKKNVPKAKEQTFSAMKRDQSLLFTTVPEEDPDHQSPLEINTEVKIEEKPVLDQIPKRPKSLNLKFTPYESKPKETVTTPFNYKTSVCSTPLTEKYLHFKPHNIISDSDIEMIEFKQKGVELERAESVNSILSLEEKYLNKDFNYHLSDFIMTTKVLDRKKSASFLPLNQKPIFMRSYGLGLSDITSSDSKEHLYNTITDPLFPIFRSNGTVISKTLYDFYVSKHFDLFNPDFFEENLNSITNTEDWKSLDDFDTDFKDSPKKKNNNATDFNSKLNSLDMSTLEPKLELNMSRRLKNIRSSNNSIQTNNNVTVAEGQSEIKLNKANLSLPLKTTFGESIKNDLSEQGPKIANSQRPALTLPLKSLSTESESFAFSRKNNGVQLTPLMSKLSLLAAIEDRSSGFCSRDTTPMTEFRDLLTPSDKFLRRGSIKKMESFESDDDDEDFKKSVLFVCGQQDTVLTLLLDEGAVENEKLIRDLWEICIDNLGQLETQLRQCLEQYPGATNGTSEMSEDDTYSYLCLDPHWEATRRGGPWAISELGMLNQMHREFKGASELMEISLRNEDGIVYGYRCGETEVYYQQAAPSNPGLPPPADAMGVAPLKAKRKLERDHGIILL